MRHANAFVVLGCLVGGTAWAGQADVCYSTPVSSAQPDPLTASTPLNCPLAGRHGLAQLAQAGWTVAAVQPAIADYSVDPATQTPRSSTSWMVVVQKESK